MNNRFALCLARIAGLCVLCMTGCQSVKDFQPGDSDNLPDSVLMVFQNTVPNAKNVVFKTIEENWLYEVNYTLDDRRAFGLLDKQRVLLNYWGTSDALPDSLRRMFNELAPSEGTITGFWEPVIQDPVHKFYFNNIDLMGRRYLMRILATPSTVTGKIEHHFEVGRSWRFTLQGPPPNQVPAQIKSALTARNLKYVSTNMGINEDGTRTYDVAAQDESESKYSRLIFNNEGKLLCIPDVTSERVVGLAALPVPIQDYIKSSPFKDFGSVYGYKLTDPEAPGFMVIMGEVKPDQIWKAVFDQSNNLVHMEYSAMR